MSTNVFLSKPNMFNIQQDLTYISDTSDSYDKSDKPYILNSLDISDISDRSYRSDRSVEEKNLTNRKNISQVWKISHKICQPHPKSEVNRFFKFKYIIKTTN